MMRNLIIIALMLFPFCCLANEIDQLKTIGDVNFFMRKVAGKKWDGSFFKAKPDSTLGILNQKFLKIDINDDGLTDLILNGENIAAIVDDGKGGYHFNFVNNEGGILPKVFFLTGIDTIKPAKLIVTNYSFRHPKHPLETDTIVVKFGDFIEYNVRFNRSQINNIFFSTSMCFGECPVFTLLIQRNGKAEYDAKKFNPEHGFYSGTITQAALDQLLQLLEYIDPPRLNNSYSVNWTDLQTATLKINYKNGDSKTIEDYGMSGTFGLRQLYRRLLALRKSQTWYENSDN